MKEQAGIGEMKAVAQDMYMSQAPGLFINYITLIVDIYMYFVELVNVILFYFYFSIQ